jgi:hypothetical protein
VCGKAGVAVPHGKWCRPPEPVRAVMARNCPLRFNLTLRSTRHLGAASQRPATRTLSSPNSGCLERSQIIFPQWFTATVAQTLGRAAVSETLPEIRPSAHPHKRQTPRRAARFITSYCRLGKPCRRSPHPRGCPPSYYRPSVLCSSVQAPASSLSAGRLSPRSISPAHLPHLLSR